MANISFGVFVYIFMSLINRYHSADIPSVSTGLGTITGETKNVTFQKNEYQIDRYLGIPYAKPPTGDLRFQPPEPIDPFSETYNAVEFGASCPQAADPHLPVEKKTDEDCLFLNIFVPRQKADEPSGHAVMFFIHGGAFTTGSAYLYDSSVLSALGNVIVVTINYRLGLLGFLDLDDERASGNFGLLDQRLALQWVNENIGVFGGDKERVTIFGESAGAMSVAMQMMYPPNKGLFRSGITQSGALGFPEIFKENNIDKAKSIAKGLSCSVETTDEVFNCLKKASTEEIIKVVENPETSFGLDSAATIDGKFVKQNLNSLLQKAQMESSEEIDFFRSIKLMNGVNDKEGASFLLLLGDAESLENYELSRDDMNNLYIPDILAGIYGANKLNEVLKQLITSEYTDWENPDDPKRPREQLVNLFGDIYFDVPAIDMSRIHSNASNVDSFVYKFVLKPDKPILTLPTWANYATHGDELAPVFGYNFDPEFFYNIPEYTPPEWELELSKRMMIYWTNFAKTGNPNKPDSELSGVWPKYNIKDQFFINFDKEDSIGQYMSARPTEIWRKLVPAVMEASEHAQACALFGKREEQVCTEDGSCG